MSTVVGEWEAILRFNRSPLMQGLSGASLLPTGVPYTDETAPIPLEDVDVDDSLPSIAAQSAFVDGKGSFRQVRIATQNEWQTVRNTAIVHALRNKIRLRQSIYFVPLTWHSIITCVLACSLLSPWLLDSNSLRYGFIIPSFVLAEWQLIQGQTFWP
jgi:hypothetical protein